MKIIAMMSDEFTGEFLVPPEGFDAEKSRQEWLAWYREVLTPDRRDWQSRRFAAGVRTTEEDAAFRVNNPWPEQITLTQWFINDGCRLATDDEVQVVET